MKVLRGRIGTYDGASPHVSNPLGGDYVVIIAGGVYWSVVRAEYPLSLGDRSTQGARGEPLRGDDRKPSRAT